MSVLVVGASGATGRLLVEQLLNMKQNVKVVVRDADRLPDTLKGNPDLSITEASLLDLTESALFDQVKDCDAVASCLGHNLSLKGIFGQPRRLVTEATMRLCNAIKSVNTGQPVRFVLMNTTANRNGDTDEKNSFSEGIVIGLLRFLLPPQADNEEAVEFLRAQIGQDDGAIEWVAVRPDTLIDEEIVTDYEPHASPTTSPIFAPGKTSRINVGHFMASLITDDALWHKWKGHMPVIYNRQ